MEFIMDCEILTVVRRKAKQNGIISIEFIAAVPVLFILLLFFLEMCRMISLCAVIDLALAESGRHTARLSITSETYRQAFLTHLKNNKRSLFNYFLPTAYDSDKGIKVNVTYCASLQDIINSKCNDNQSLKFAIYNINYDYKPLFIALPNMVKDKISFRRKIVYVQEQSRNNK